MDAIFQNPLAKRTEIKLGRSDILSVSFYSGYLTILYVKANYLSFLLAF